MEVLDQPLVRRLERLLAQTHPTRGGNVLFGSLEDEFLALSLVGASVSGPVGDVFFQIFCVPSRVGCLVRFIFESPPVPFPTGGKQDSRFGPTGFPSSRICANMSSSQIRTAIDNQTRPACCLEL